jgi:WD40 repeat protein
VVWDALTRKSVFTQARPDGKVLKVLDGPQPLAMSFDPVCGIKGRKLNRFAFTDGRSLTVYTWLDDALPGRATFGPLADAPKLDGQPPAGVAYSPVGKQLVFIPNNKIDPDWVSGKSKTPQPDPAKATHWYAQVWGGGSGAPMAILPHGTQPVTAVAWSPDGKWIATGSADGVVVLWDGKSFQEARRVDLGGGGEGLNRIHGLAFAPDGKTVAAAIERGEGKNARRVILLDPSTGKRTQEQDLQFFWNAPPVALAFSPDGKTLIVGCGLRDFERRNLTPEEWKKAGEVHVFTTEPEVNAPDPNPEPAQAPVGAWMEKATLTDHDGPVDSVAFAPDGKEFVSGGAGGRVLVWDAEKLTSFEVTKKLWDAIGMSSPQPSNRKIGETCAVAFSPDGKRVVATRPRACGVFDWPGGRVLNKAVPGGTAVAFDRTGERVAVSDGFTTTILSLSGNEPPQKIDGPGEQKGLANKFPAGLAWSPDGKRLAFLHLVAGGGGAEVREIGGNGAQKRLGGPDVQPVAIAWSSDGKLIVTGQADGTVSTWDAETYREQSRLKIAAPGLSPRLGAVAFAPDGKTVVAGVSFRQAGVTSDAAAVPRTDAIPNGDRVAIIDVPTSKLDLATVKCTAPVRSLVFSPDGKTLLVAYGIDREKMKPRMSEAELKVAGGIAVWHRAEGR